MRSTFDDVAVRNLASDAECDAPLRVACFTDAADHAVTHVEPAGLAVRLIVSLGDRIRVSDDPRFHRAFVVGLRDRPTSTFDDGAVDIVDVQLDPRHTAGLLGATAAELSGAVVGLDDLWGARADEFVARLEIASSPAERAELARRWFLVHRLASRPTDPVVDEAWRRLRRGGDQHSMRDLARSAGRSEDWLRRRYREHIGIGIKRTALIVRFSNARRCLASGASPTSVAVHLGYSDVAHLHRDVRRFAGTVPSALV